MQILPAELEDAMIDPAAVADLARFDAAFTPSLDERDGHLLWDLVESPPGWWTLTITQQRAGKRGPGKPKTHLYHVFRVGLTEFELENFQQQSRRYSVLLPRGVCGCPGAEFGHQCKHALAMVDLWSRGKLQALPVKARQAT